MQHQDLEHLNIIISEPQYELWTIGQENTTMKRLNFNKKKYNECKGLIKKILLEDHNLTKSELLNDEKKLFKKEDIPNISCSLYNSTCFS